MQEVTTPIIAQQKNPNINFAESLFLMLIVLSVFIYSFFCSIDSVENTGHSIIVGVVPWLVVNFGMLVFIFSFYVLFKTKNLFITIQLWLGSIFAFLFPTMTFFDNYLNKQIIIHTWIDTFYPLLFALGIGVVISSVICFIAITLHK